MKKLTRVLLMKLLILLIVTSCVSRPLIIDKYDFPEIIRPIKIDSEYNSEQYDYIIQQYGTLVIDYLSYIEMLVARVHAVDYQKIRVVDNNEEK